MRFKFRRDNFYRENYYKYELKHKICNSLTNHIIFPFILKLAILRYSNRIKPIRIFMKVRNRCVLTIRSRSVFSSYKVSRIIFRQKAITGLLIGVKKAVW
uniref:30S ribosomal protein S14 n=1 Tax=Cyanidiococcus yangmingshanensis TaxID=2690220 RepID=A0A7H0WBG3_9RHOD|nr:30S ribosomal protein S14 [Cyanidiococcus yangmingshanensis]UNJ18938.1 ribosomal protein S14 [Cyanidioschyzonaceae sp. 2 FvB-2021]